MNMTTAGDSVTFSADGASGGDGHTISNHEWKINGIIQGNTGPTISHTLEVGTTTVELRVQNDCGNWSYPQTIELYAEAFCPIPTLSGIAVS